MNHNRVGKAKGVTTPSKPEPSVPGWYPSPVGNGSVTYWDGVGWTDRTRPRGMSAVGLVALGVPTGLAGLLLAAASSGVLAFAGLLLGILGVVVTLVGTISYGVAHGIQHAEWRRWD